MLDFTEGVLKHAGVLASYAHKLTQDKHNAQDLCQETMFKALANRDSFKRGSDVKPWLFTIMRNLFFNSYRRQRIEKKLFTYEPVEMLDHEDPVTLASTYRAELKATQSVIQAMPDILRIPIHLRSEGYKYEEIASITDTPIGTTKSRIFMARQLLRKNLMRDAT